jgi:predicted DNA-binding WGR domain protein
VSQPVAVCHQPELFPADLLAQFRASIRFVSLGPARNRARFYRLHWQPTLWGELALVQTWGRLGTAGRTRVAIYPDRLSAQENIARVIIHRLRHDYTLIGWD